jgi:hypoxanthine phosphoribosyltransferase
MQKVKYSWVDFETDFLKLLKKIKRHKYSPETIVCLARGGLVIGLKLSHKLKKPLMIVSCKTYTQEGQQSSTTLLNSSYTVPLKSPVLIVDEISDSGRTLKLVKEHFESLGVEVKTATLLYKKHSIIKPDYYAREVDNESWMVFIWET